MTGGVERRERMLIRLFGVLAIEDGTRTLGPRDLGGARPKQVLEILLAARGHRVPTDRLAELLWGEELPQNAAGSLQTFVSVLRRHLVSDRERARAHRTAMLALYALGRQHDALEAYRGFRARLDGELGLEPTAETRALESAILRQEDIRSLLPRPIRRAQVDPGERSVRLLGRTSELDALERGVRRALDGSCALLMVEGEAGLGKTRLLDEFAASLVGVRLGRASCSELERHLPYVPLAAALRGALPGAELDAQRLPALRQILPELTLGEPPEEFAEVDALEALVALIAGHAPLVLLFDDLQSADVSTLAALGYLRHRCAG